MALPTRVVRGTAVSVTMLLAATLLGGPVAGQEEWPGADAVVLEQARSGHTATLLPDDYVLVAGGTDGAEELASVELVDPIGMAIEPLGPLVLSRSGHTATLLDDGRILVAGGRVGDRSLSEAELYDTYSGQSELAGDMLSARVEHQAVPLADGRVLFVGGLAKGKPVMQAEIFDPTTAEFTTAAQPAANHLDAVAIGLPDGRVLLMGRVQAGNAKASEASKKAKKKAKNKKAKKKADQKQAAPASAEIYDPTNDQWSPVAGGGAGVGHEAILLADGRVLVVGGSDLAGEVFDPETRAFVATGQLPAPRSGHTMSLLPDGRVLIAGGADDGFELAALEVYDPAGGGLDTGGEMLIPRIGHTATSLVDGRVLLSGGDFAGHVLDDLLVYDPSAAALRHLSIDMDLPLEPTEPASAGSTRADIRAQHGAPDAFAIYYFDEVVPDGSTRATSLEEWSYYGTGLEFTFEGDQVVSEDEATPVGAMARPVPYDPDVFDAYMSLGQVVDAVGLDEYLGGPADESIEGGEIFFGDGLVWGMKDGELRYIEALAFEAADDQEEVD